MHLRDAPGLIQNVAGDVRIILRIILEVGGHEDKAHIAHSTDVGPSGQVHGQMALRLHLACGSWPAQRGWWVRVRV